MKTIRIAVIASVFLIAASTYLLALLVIHLLLPRLEPAPI